MKLQISGVMLLASAMTYQAMAHSSPADLLGGIYTNEEQVYFENLAERPAPDWFSIRIRSDGDSFLVEKPDAFGVAKDKPSHFTVKQDGSTTVLDYGLCKRLYRHEHAALIATGSRGICSAAGGTITEITPYAITLTFPDGTTTQLRRARAVSCWVAIRKDQPKQDGSEDWFFDNNVRIHDQGGRALVGGGETGTQQVMIRLRNVTWGKGSTNAPVLALYIHKADNWDHAESYSWAAPDSARVGINLRWVQTGCSIEGMTPPSNLSADKFIKQEEDKK